MRLVVASPNGVDHPNERGRPICGDERHPRASDGTLSRNHCRDVGRLDD